MKGTMRKMNCLLSAFVVAVAFSGCLKIDTPENWTKEPEKEPECLSLKKVDSQQRVNNGVFTHPETVQLL